MSPIYEQVKVETYSGYKGEETPRAILIEGKRFGIASILSRQRVLDPTGGGMRDIWRCRLDDGRAVTVELLENGAWRVSL